MFESKSIPDTNPILAFNNRLARESQLDHAALAASAVETLRLRRQAAQTPEVGIEIAPAALLAKLGELAADWIMNIKK